MEKVGCVIENLQLILSATVILKKIKVLRCFIDTVFIL